ncbi:MAG: hypothetical protein JKY92_01780 [Magnetovibrio sp.]|nr:hypothetical protein [Magnetovibrio sp.]
MGECCSTSPAEKMPCPKHGGSCKGVSLKTVKQHIKQPWTLDPTPQQYFFCEDPNCDVVYFSDTGWTAHQAQVRTPIGVKDASAAAVLCYCFGVTRADVKKDPAIKAFVLAQTKQRQCACEIRNPSGRCCLKNFPR